MGERRGGGEREVGWLARVCMDMGGRVTWTLGLVLAGGEGVGRKKREGRRDGGPAS